MRCIAKIAEVVYPKLESRRPVPLTPRRRTHSMSGPRDFPSPVARNDDSDNTRESDADGATDERQSSSREPTTQDDARDENSKSAADKLEQQSDDSSSPGDSSQTQTPESRNRPGHSSHGEQERYSSVMTKMLFEILQNLLADVLTILEKVMVHELIYR